MGRKNYIPGSNKSDKAIYSYETVSFASAVVKGQAASQVPPDGLADAYDVVIYPDEIQGREGSTLYTSVVIPPIDGMDGYIGVTKTGNIITFPFPIFFPGDIEIGSFFVFPGDPDKHYEVTEYIASDRIRVSNSITNHTATDNCYFRGATNLQAWHKTQKKWIFIWGDQIYTADIELSSLTRCPIISVGETMDSSVSLYDDFDENTGIIFNSNGMFKIDFSYDPPVVYKINIPTPSNTILDEEETETSKYNYHYLYSAMRLNDDEQGADRLTPKAIELETGSNKWETDTYRDYADVYTDNPVGPTYSLIKLKYCVVTCGTLISPYDNVGGWQALSQNGSFVININGIGINEIVVDFSNVTNMKEAAALIQSALRDFFTTATCDFDVDHFVITSGKVYGGTISDIGVGISANTINIYTLMGLDISITSYEDVTNNNTIGPLYVPEIIGTSEYQQHLTHFSIYRTKDLKGRYQINDEADKLNNPNDFVLVKDLRICAAFYGEYTAANNLFTAFGGRGYFEEEDVGSILELENGFRFEITQVVDYYLAYLEPVSSIFDIDIPYTAAAIGNGRVFRASQNGNTVTRTHGDIFYINDQWKSIKWADGTWDYITQYVSPNEVLVNSSQTRITTGMTMDPTYRNFNDTITDETLETRLTRLKLKQRFWQPMPNGNIGKVLPGLIFTANQDEGQLNYGQIPDTLEYLHGFHDQAYQITKKVSDNIQAIWLFQDILIIWTTSKTWRWPTGSYQYIINPYTRDSILQISGLEIADEDRGCYSRGSIEAIGNGNVTLLTYEGGKIGWRAYNGYQYSDDFLEGIMGRQRLPEIQDLSKSTKTLYNGQTGMMLFGKE